jgi:hypothetical protein
VLPDPAQGRRRPFGRARERHQLHRDAGAGAGVTINDVGYISITMVGGAHDGEVGNVKTSELKDAGDGNATVDLPVPKVKLTTAATALFKKETGDDKVKDLPKDTRVTVKKTSNGRSQGQVVDGPDTAKEGWIDSSKLNDE